MKAVQNHKRIMKKEKVESNHSNGLRRQAEERLEARQSGPVVSKTADDVDAMALVHELQVQQIELEMQNDELKHAKLETEDALAKYSDLYDFAPIGLFTLDAQRLIQEVNLAGAALLGIDRSNLIKKRFRLFVAPKDRPIFDEFCKSVFETSIKQTCELNLLMDGEPAIYANIHGNAAEDDSQNGKRCRIAVIDITERKQAEEILTNQGAVLKAVLESSKGPIFSVDSNYRYTCFNSRHAEVMKALFGADIEIGHSILDYHTNLDDRISAQMNIDRSLCGESLTMEASAGNETLSRRFFEISHNPVRDTHGEVTGAAIYARDITERMRIDNELSETRDYLENLIDHANAPIIVWDTSFNITRFNQAFERLTGLEANRVIGEPLRILFPENSREDSLACMRRTLSGEFWEVVEIPIQKTDGSVRTVLWNSANIYDKDGATVLSTIAQGQDITELKQAMQDGEILARFPKENPNPVMRISTDGAIIFANPSSAPLLKTWGRQVGEMLPDNYRNLVLDAYRSGNRIEAEAASGDTTFLLIFAPIADMGYVNIYGRDITRRKLADKALMERAQDLAKKTEDLARSNAELEQFAYVASHDLQEPLRIVTSYAQHLEKRYKGKLDPEADEFIGFIVDGTKRMERLIKGLLAYSRVGTRGKPFERIETEAVLKAAIQNLQLAIEDSKGRVTHDPLPVIVADESQMVELFQNLIGNGLKFHGDDSPIVHISARRDGRGWIFSFKDNGIGIDPQHYAKLFIIFQRLNPRDFPGTGIGLAISKKIVERHGGRIWVDSAPGKGSTFYFLIPDRDESAADKPIENFTD